MGLYESLGSYHKSCLVQSGYCSRGTKFFKVSIAKFENPGSPVQFCTGNFKILGPLGYDTLTGHDLW